MTVSWTLKSLEQASQGHCSLSLVCSVQLSSKYWNANPQILDAAVLMSLLPAIRLQEVPSASSCSSSGQLPALGWLHFLCSVRLGSSSCCNLTEFSRDGDKTRRLVEVRGNTPHLSQGAKSQTVSTLPCQRESFFFLHPEELILASSQDDLCVLFNVRDLMEVRFISFF